jgi:hypothetical protein
VIQLDTNYTVNASLPATASFIRVSDSGSATGEVPNLMNIEAGPAATIVATGTVGGTLKGVKIRIDGTTYYLQAGTTCA